MRIPIQFPTCTLLVCALAAAACAGDADTSDSATASATPATEMAAQTGTVSLADVAGKWTVRATPESGDTTTTTYVLTATADTSGWTVTYPGGQPIPVRVRVDGDSIMTEAGPYDSVRRPGVKVRTTSVGRISGNSMTGTGVARYTTTGADSVLRLRLAGTRTP